MRTLKTVFFLILAVPAIHEAVSAATIARVMRLSQQGYSVPVRGIQTEFSNGETIRTEPGEKKTIQFRNGSIVRLFSDSALEIRKFFEFNSVQRLFDVRLFLARGAAVFYSDKNTLRGAVLSENITITRIADTLFVLDKRGRYSNLAVSKGNPLVSNRLYSHTVPSGLMVRDVGFLNDFKDGINASELYILTKSDKSELALEGREVDKIIGFSGQLLDRVKLDIVPQGLPVIFFSPVLDERQPSSRALNDRGFTFYNYIFIGSEKLLHGMDRIFFAFMPDDPDYWNIVGKPAYLSINQQAER